MAVKRNVVTKIPWKKMWQVDKENVQAVTAECRRHKASCKISVFHVGKVLKAAGRRAKGRRNIHFLALRVG